MKQVIIMPGGFHPFHAGHYALYKQAQDAFPGADVYVAATNDTSARPFPFAVKEKLAKLAGVAPGHFVQVKSPFQAREITANLDPENTQLIFVRSQKDANKPPQAGGVKKNGEPSYLQPLAGNEDNLLPMNQRAYMAYLPTVEFGPGMTSATEIRTAWPRLNEKRKTALVMSLYPKTQTNPRLAANVVKMLDTAIGTELDEGYIFKGKFPFDVDHMPGAVHRNRDETTDIVKTKNKDRWEDMVDLINDEVFDDMADFRTNSEGETVTGNSAVWAKWDNSTQTGWINRKGQPLKPWPVKEQGMAEAGNKPLEPHFGMGDSSTPRELKTQMRGASDEFVRSTADKKTGPFHSKVAKMQGKLAKSELRRREQGLAEDYIDEKK